MSNKTSSYTPVTQYGMDEIRALKPVIGKADFCKIGGFSLNKGGVLIKSLIEDGTLKSARKVGRTWMMSKAEVLEYFGLACE